MNILKETMEHFEPKKENKQDDWREFRRFYANGCSVVDLTSVDDGWSGCEAINRAEDIERQGIYGNLAGDINKM